jgi:hypothetical protein
MAGILTDSIYAGATLDLSVTLTAFPAPDWSLRLFLRGPTQIDLISAADGTAHRLAASAAVTSGWDSGVYWYSLRAQNGADVQIVEEGQITIRQDVAAIIGTHDGRTHAERVLAAIEAVIENRATVDQQAYEINGRSLTRTPINDLLKLRATYRDEVRRERQAKRSGQSLFGRTIKARI